MTVNAVTDINVSLHDIPIIMTFYDRCNEGGNADLYSTMHPTTIHHTLHHTTHTQYIHITLHTLHYTHYTTLHITQHTVPYLAMKWRQEPSMEKW